MKHLVLATNNLDKVRELKEMLPGTGIEVHTLSEFPQVGPVSEDGATLEENALKKARVVFRATGIPALADDSGLEVHYLRGEPGLFSSRYSGEGATYESNCRKLLAAMLGVPPRRRGARFRSVIAFVGKNVEELVEGVCRGSITESPRGANGFGYDPIFVPAGYNLTFAEMDPAMKNRISHRALALQKAVPVVEKYFSGQ
jgi:XTP/dITP diphosphohydrolase